MSLRNRLKTINVTREDGSPIRINETDFDEKIHTKIDDEKPAAKKTGGKKKTTKKPTKAEQKKIDDAAAAVIPEDAVVIKGEGGRSFIVNAASEPVVHPSIAPEGYDDDGAAWAALMEARQTAG